MNVYDLSERQGLLRNMEACRLLLPDLRRIQQKLKKRVDKDTAKQQAEFKEILSFGSDEEIRDAYGWGYISQKKCDLYIRLYEQGRDILDRPLENKYTAALEILSRIVRDIEILGEQCRFDALPPEKQAEEMRHYEERQKAWENHKKEMLKQFKNTEESQ